MLANQALPNALDAVDLKGADAQRCRTHDVFMHIVKYAYKRAKRSTFRHDMIALEARRQSAKRIDE
jgi:hypothetical protein